MNIKKVVKDLMIEKFVKVGEEDQIYEVVEKIAQDKETMLACVVDKDNVLKGIITPREILEAVEVREFGTIRYPFLTGRDALHILTSKCAKDIMNPPVSVKADDEVEKAINIMLDKGFYEVPVVDKEGKTWGAINYFSIIISSVDYLKKQ